MNFEKTRDARKLQSQGNRQINPPTNKQSAPRQPLPTTNYQLPIVNCELHMFSSSHVSAKSKISNPNPMHITRTKEKFTCSQNSSTQFRVLPISSGPCYKASSHKMIVGALPILVSTQDVVNMLHTWASLKSGCFMSLVTALRSAGPLF